MNELINKFLGMNSETRTRTITAAVVYILNFLVIFHVIEFSNEQIQAVAQLVAVIATGVAWFFSHYKNNDYTEEACIGTGITRQLKAEKKDDYIGDFFYAEDYEAEDADAVDDEEEGDEDE